jgi:hypothetical protein
MKYGIFGLFIGLALNCFGQNSKVLILSDSITIKSSFVNSYLQDINLIDGNFWVRFDSWQKNGIFIELSNQKGATYTFTTSDSSIVTETGQLYSSPNGFFFPKYSGENTVINLDTLNKRIISKRLDYDRDNFIFYPNTNALLRNSSGFKFPLLILSTVSIDIQNRSNKKLEKSLEKVFKKEKLFAAYNLNNNTYSLFGTFPQIYRDRNFIIGNKEYFFVADSVNNRLLVSFQALDSIEVYDLSTLKKKLTFGKRGLNINPRNLLMEYKHTSDYINKDFLNLLSDSYDDIFLISNGIIRMYRKGFDLAELNGILPPKGADVCPSPLLKIKWLEKRVNKKIFLQQFNLSGDLLFEIDVPKNVNRFIGYNEKKNEYYFWKQIFSRNVNGAVIYIFKPSPK